MDSKKTIIEKIKVLFAEIEAPTVETTEEVTDGAFADFLTTEGLVLRIEEDVLAEGVVISAIDGDDNAQPTPEGEYTLEDGRVIKTDADSKVASIEEAVAEEAEVEVEEEMAAETEETTEEVEETEEVTEEATEEVEETEDNTEERIAALETEIAKIVGMFSAMKSTVELLGAEPAKDEVRLKSKQFSVAKEQADKKNEMFKKIANSRSKK